MHLTIIAGEQVSSLDVPPDMELENFLALCRFELSSLDNVPAEKQLALNCSGRQFIANPGLAKKQLQELNIRDGDAIYFELVSTSSSAQTPLSAGSTPASSSSASVSPPRPGAAANLLISSLVQAIKVPASKKRGNDGGMGETEDKKMAEQIHAMLADPYRLDFLRVDHPDLVAAYETNPEDKEAFFAAFKKNKEEQARRIRLMYDENSEEGQRYIAEKIERERIERIQELAMEHMPEAFVPVHMLYIRMMINNHPVMAFVDSGAQTSILSESCAMRCDILRVVDRRYRVQAVGIGGMQKMIGRIYACQVQVNHHIFTCPFEVMADRDMDILFGLNTLMRHKCCIDLAKMVLRFGDGTEAPFLSEEEIRREKEAIATVQALADIEAAEAAKGKDGEGDEAEGAKRKN